MESNSKEGITANILEVDRINQTMMYEAGECSLEQFHKEKLRQNLIWK